ncbi:MAG: D-alanyl-D-alanine carboxypeptidase family protein [Verrucomicrobiota bacterium]|nr:D-alanyl-D-alanine carboxypeptidase family protein [Verrucomicrobiota bacterium]
MKLIIRILAVLILSIIFLFTAIFFLSEKDESVRPTKEKIENKIIENRNKLIEQGKEKISQIRKSVIEKTLSISKKESSTDSTKKLLLPSDFKNVSINLPGILKRKLEANTKAGILIDLNKKEILWGKKINEPLPIASMTKMMTILLCIESVKAGEISLSDEVKISKNAEKIGGRQIYLNSRETMLLRDLFKAAIIFSANDATYQIAEYLAGSERKFVTKMNIKARRLHLPKSRFYNTNGLPERRDNISTPLEMAIIASYLLNYPEVLKYSTCQLDYIRKDTKPFQLSSTNKRLLKSCQGVNGMKTGYIKSSGSCITVTCERNGKTMIAVLMGVKKAKLRDELAKKLLNCGYAVTYNK